VFDLESETGALSDFVLARWVQIHLAYTYQWWSPREHVLGLEDPRGHS